MDGTGSDTPRIVAPSGEGGDPSRGRRPDATDVFCQSPLGTPVLFETEHLRVIPDMYPIAPGHVLIIPKAHAAAFGALPASWDAEIEYAVGRVQRFVREMYAREPLVWENGAVGQSVRHAHLHVIPLPVTVVRLPSAIDGRPSYGLPSLRRALRRDGSYHYARFRDEERVLPARSADVRVMSILKVAALRTPMTPDRRAWVRSPNPVEVARCALLYARYQRAHSQERFVTAPHRDGFGLAA